MARYATVAYDDADDFVHIQYLPVVLGKPADVVGFASEIDAFMSKLGRKVDIIIDLGEMVVRPAAMAKYDEERQRMFQAYAKRAYRYHGSALVRTRILTSSTIHDQRANIYKSLAEARTALLGDRKREP